MTHTLPEVEAAPFAEIVGAIHVRVANEADVIDEAAPQLVVAPGSGSEVAQAVKLAAESGLGVLPRGGGTKSGWGSRPSSAQLVLETGRMAAVLEHAWGDMTATVHPLFPERATVGGVLATNDSGPLRVRYGSLRDQVIGMTVALADGTLARSGGKVVKNVAGYDLPKLMTGALGTLGVIVEATFRLYPLAAAVRELRLDAPDLQSANRALLAVLDSTLAPSAIQLRAGSAAVPQLDLRFEGLPAALEAQERQLAEYTGLRPQPGDPQIWRAGEALWAAPTALVCRVSVLPADIAKLCAAAERLASVLRLSWAAAVGGLGVGWLRLEGANDEVLLAALARLRDDIAGFGGSLAALGCPASLKPRIDVWGEQGDMLPLMRRVKQRFDPNGALNPGRFVGGI
jgi:glycolate oxidase FAD binding subunit